MQEMITANRLADGLVVFLDAAGGWSEDFHAGFVLEDAAAKEKALSIAARAAADNLVVDPYPSNSNCGRAIWRRKRCASASGRRARRCARISASRRKARADPCAARLRRHPHVRYDEFDAAFVAARVEQFRDQVERRIAGELTEDQFRPHRLMNGLYLQLHAYMLRVAVPYGMLNSAASCASSPTSRANTTAATAISRRGRTCSSTGRR